jgi:hypothetical protein
VCTKRRRLRHDASHATPFQPRPRPIVEGSDATQALDRKPDAALFPIVDARKTLAWSNAQTGTSADSARCHETASCIQSASISEFVRPG